jgi:hypothetical protein
MFASLAATQPQLFVSLLTPRTSQRIIATLRNLVASSVRDRHNVSAPVSDLSVEHLTLYYAGSNLPRDKDELNHGHSRLASPSIVDLERAELKA